MVTSIEKVVTKKTSTGKNGRGSNGNGHYPPNGNDKEGPGPNSEKDRFSPDKYRIAMWVALAAILMMFTAIVSAYVVLASSDGWRSIPLPRTLWLSTALIVCSSLTLEKALGYFKAGDEAGYGRWLSITLVLGLAFLGSQLIAWLQLIARGIQLAGNARAFFYLLTGLHGVHVIGGIGALTYLMMRKRIEADPEVAVLKRRTTAVVVGLYWHFMDVLWISLFLLLMIWG